MRYTDELYLTIELVPDIPDLTEIRGYRRTGNADSVRRVIPSTVSSPS